MVNTTIETQLMSARELGDLLQLHADTVRKAAKAGLIPCVRIGGTIRFSGAQVAQITRDGFAWPKRKTN